MSVHAASGVALQQCDKCPSIWLGAAEREAVWLSDAVRRKQQQPHFVPGKSAPSVRCPSCEGGRLQLGRVGEREVMCCASCKGIFVSFRRWPPADEQANTWPEVLSGVLELLFLLP